MAYVLQQLINGVTLGMIYGLIAIGYTMVYGIIGMINFAHGDIFMVGSFLSLIALLLLLRLGLTFVPLALVLVLFIAMALPHCSAGRSSASPTARSEVHSVSRP